MVLVRVLSIFSLLALLEATLPESVDAKEDAAMPGQTAELEAGRERQTAVDRAVKRVLSANFIANTKGLRDALSQIEVQLAREVELDEPGANLERLVEMLEETEDTSGIPVSRLNGLQLLASLDKVWRGNTECNHESHTILSKNNEALMGTVQVPLSKFPARPKRIQAVLRKIAEKHAEDCKLLYADAYERLAQKFPADLYRDIKTFIDLIVEVHIKKSKPSWSLFGGWRPKLEASDTCNARKVIESFESVAGRDEAEIAYDFLKNYIQGDPDQWYLTRVPVSATDNRLVLNEDKIRQLLWRYLIEPCAEYVGLMGAPVFEPVEFDAQILENDDRHLKPEMADFQMARIRYNICKRLVHTDHKELLSAIVGLANKAPIHEFN